MPTDPTTERVTHYPPEAVLTPDEAAAALGVDVPTLMASNVRRARVNANTFRFFGADVTAAMRDGLKARAWALAPRGGRPSNLYVLRNPLTGHIKIGIADNVAERVRSLSYACGVALEIVTQLPGGREGVAEAEAVYHARLASDRLLGEWFAPTDAVMAAVAEIALAARGGCDG